LNKPAKKDINSGVHGAALCSFFVGVSRIINNLVLD